MKIEKTPFYSWKIGKLAKGCQLCVKGEKSVLFVTGLCSKNCFYCPISDKKKNKDVIYINEWPTKEIKDIIREIKLCSSRGIGITGGDPLAKLERTIDLIKKLKKVFGKKFHIHLYTPLNLVDEKNLEKLYKAGLDEIRFHLNIDKKSEWNKINLSKKFKWKAGVEIPVIPKKKKETVDLINYLNIIKIDFLNLNELEISDTNAQKLVEKGFVTKDRVSYGVLGSERLAIELLRYIQKNDINLNVHYCTTKLKDGVQLAKRIKRRAANTKRRFDIVSGEGMLIRGAIYLKELYPGFGYENKLLNLNKHKRNNLIKKLDSLKNKLIKNFKINKKMVEVDKHKLRVLTSKKMIKELKNQLKDKDLIFAVVEEYPTYDSLIVEIDFLG